MKYPIKFIVDYHRPGDGPFKAGQVHECDTPESRDHYCRRGVAVFERKKPGPKPKIKDKIIDNG